MLLKKETEMRKTFKKIAMLATATVAIGVASLTSCTKEDESLTNNVPAMELKSQAVPQAWRVDPKCLWYRYETRIENGDTNTVLICDHLKFVWMTDKDLCGLRLDAADEDVAIASMETAEGQVRRLILQSDKLSIDIRSIYEKFISIGKITFSEKCLITDSEIVNVLDLNYIPEGSYPIVQEGNEIIITISE